MRERQAKTLPFLNVPNNPMKNFAKVVVRNVRIETRVTKRDLVTQHVIRGHVGERHPHLVFNFNVKIDGTVKKFDINKLKLSGCELQLLGRMKKR